MAGFFSGRIVSHVVVGVVHRVSMIGVWSLHGGWHGLSLVKVHGGVHGCGLLLVHGGLLLEEGVVVVEGHVVHRRRAFFV